MDIYLDNAASTPIDPRVLRHYDKVSAEAWGNPSNTFHSYGQKAREILEESRFGVSNILGVDPSGLIFTSGATEANNLALRGLKCLKSGRCALVISSIEHPCVLEAAQNLSRLGVIVRQVPVLPSGIVDLEALQKAIFTPPYAKLVSIMAVNNETGVIQPLDQISNLTKQAGAIMHTDATQGVGKLPVEMLQQADMISFSGHKIHGPKGVGALWVRPRIELEPILYGGGQEAGVRSGTIPVPLIAALAKALELAYTDSGWLHKLNYPMRHLEQSIVFHVPGAKVNGSESIRIPNVVNISFPWSDQVIKHIKDLAISSGSACSCAKPEPSRVLSNMGLPEEMAKNNIRVSAGRLNTPKDIYKATDLIIKAANESRTQGA